MWLAEKISTIAWQLPQATVQVQRTLYSTVIVHSTLYSGCMYCALYKFLPYSPIYVTRLYTKSPTTQRFSYLYL